MSAMEHLIMQIFDRKSWIEGQLWHQSQSYDELLAYNLLAQGKQPPPWLWPTGSNGCDLPDPKGQNSDRLHSGMLFSLPCAVTPSVKNSTYVTLPVFKGYEVSQPNKPTETHASEYVFSECSEKLVPSASKLTSDRITEPEVLASAVFIPCECEQYSNSRQREEEICSSGSESASHLGQSSNMEIYTGRMIRSRAHTSTPDDVRESPDMNSSLHHLNRDGDRVTLSRARSAAKANHIDQMLQPLGPSSSIENGLRKAVGSQSDMSSVPSVNLEHISCTTSTCIRGTVAMELLRADNVGESSTIMTLNNSLHPHNGDDSRVTRLRFRSKAQTDYLDKLSESVKPLNCIEGILKVVESQTEIPSIQNFDHLQTGITESAVLSTTSPVHSCLKIPSVEPMFLFDGIEEHGLNKSSDIPSLKKKQCSVGVVLTNLEAVSVNEELLCKYCEKVDGDEKDVFQNSIDEGVRSTHCGRNQDGELLEVENSRSHSYITPGVQSFHQDVNKKSSLEILAEAQQSIKLKEVMSGLDYMPAKTNSPIDPEHPACRKENNSLAINCSTSLEKGTKKNVNVLKSKKEAFGSIPVQIDSSSLNSQPEEILATVELMSGTEEANIAVQEKLDLSNSLKSDLIALPESNHRDSHVSTISYLDSGSMNPESYPTCSALDAECLSFSDGQIFLSDGCKSSSFGASTMCPIEENFREKLITETSSIYIQTICNVQNGGSALPSQTDELLKASVGEGNSSINSKKFFGSCKSSDPVIPLKSAAVCLSAHAMSMDIKEGTFAKKSRSPKTLSSQHKVPYLLRSSASVTGNCGSILANGCASCSEKNSLPPSDINLQCPENLTGKKVNCSWVTPNSIEAQSAQAKSRYCLRSLNSHDRNVASIKDASHLKQPIENITRKSEISWPKRRKVGHISNNILATSPKLRFKHFSHIQDSSDCSSNNKTSSEVEFQPVPMSTESETGILYTVSASLCKSLDHSKERHTMEGIPYLNHNGQISATPLLSEHAQDELCDTADRKSEISLKDDIRVSEASIYKSQIHSLSEDCHDSLCETIRSPNGHQELREDGESYNTLMSSRVHNTASIPEYDHALVGFDENMPEFEGFSIAFPSAVEDDTISSDSNFPTLAKERASALDQLCKPKEVNSPLMCTSWKHKIHKVPECYQSLPAGLLESLSCSLHFNDQDMKHHKESDNDQLTGLYDNSELEFGYSLVGRQYPFSIPSSSTRSNMEFKKPPLTPPLMKFGQKVVSHSSGASSEKVGSNPELVCFRIDENSSIADENGHIDELEDFKEGSSLTESKDLINRKALRDISVEFQNKPILGTLTKRIQDRESLESVNSVLSVHLSPAKGCSSQRESKVELKENSDLTVNKKVRKAALSLRNRSNKPRVSQRTTERSRSHGNMEKGCKPSNVVTNISSFIPLVRQKQQAAAPLRGSKDIKVKALEAAEAAKRIEEKKQNEREMRKAAAKLEREKNGTGKH